MEYDYHPRFKPDGVLPAKRVAKASRLVVVSAGTFGSAQLLERSGLGRKDVLNAVGVEQFVDLPGVGECYQGISMNICRIL